MKAIIVYISPLLYINDPSDLRNNYPLIVPHALHTLAISNIYKQKYSKTPNSGISLFEDSMKCWKIVYIV